MSSALQVSSSAGSVVAESFLIIARVSKSTPARPATQKRVLAPQLISRFWKGVMKRRSTRAFSASCNCSTEWLRAASGSVIGSATVASSTVVGTHPVQPSATTRGTAQTVYPMVTRIRLTGIQRRCRRVRCRALLVSETLPHSGHVCGNAACATPSMLYQHFGHRGLPRERSANRPCTSRPKPPAARSQPRMWQRGAIGYTLDAARRVTANQEYRFHRRTRQDSSRREEVPISPAR